MRGSQLCRGSTEDVFVSLTLKDGKEGAMNAVPSDK